MKIKRCISFIIVTSLIVSVLSINMLASTNTNPPLQATFTIVSEWGSHYDGLVTLTNTGTETIKNWRISCESTDIIGSMWDAKVVEHSGSYYIIENVGWNANIPPGGSVVFGFIASTNGVTKGIFNIQLISDDPSSGNPSPGVVEANISFAVTNDWGSGYNAQIEIVNTSTEIIEDWQLAFTFNHTINSVWSASLVAQKNNRYTIKNDGWNANIPVGGSVSFGFGGSPGNVAAAPSDYALFHAGIKNVDSAYEENLFLLTIDTSVFDTYDPIDDIYFIDKKLNALTGTIDDPSGVSSLTLIITSGSLELVNTPIPLTSSWSYADPNLIVYAPNTITLIIEMTDETIVEESITLINFCESNFDQSILDWDDDDNDLLPNWFEDVIGTDKNNPDTDGDGLTDYEEVFITRTDPLMFDSDGEMHRRFLDRNRLPVFKSLTASFQYDALGRLTKVTYESGHVLTYEYDAMGNIAAATEAGPPVPRRTRDLFGNLIPEMNDAVGMLRFVFGGNAYE